jgi:hypothetical protein
MVTRHHTKDKGDLAVAMVVADLIGRGAGVLNPFTEHAPFDLVAYLDGAFHRVQVKYRSAKGGAVEVVFQSSWADRHGTHRRPMPLGEVDVVAIYCPDTERCYYIDPGQFRSRVTLRVEPARNNQSANVNRAEDYLLMPPRTVNGVSALQRSKPAADPAGSDISAGREPREPPERSSCWLFRARCAAGIR